MPHFAARKVCRDLVQQSLDAFAWLNEGDSCDLIITDLQMPGMTGLELIQFMKQSGLYIVLSACNERIIECEDQGASSFIVKPFDPQKLIQEVNSILSKMVTVNRQEP